MTTAPLNVLGGLDDSAAYKVPCAVATTADMTTNMIGLPIIDGYQTQLGDRILVWQNADPTTNGIYWIPALQYPGNYPAPASCGAWVRAIDFSNTDAVYQGTQVYVNNGTLYGRLVFIVTSPSRPQFGSTPITFSQDQSAVAAETAAAQASAAAADASASAAAASAAAAGTGGTAAIAITGGTINLTTAQANAAILSLSGSLTADQFIDFPAGITNPRMIVLQGATVNGFSVYLRGNAGADTIGVWFGKLWTPPVGIIVTPTRLFWGGYESVPVGAYQDFPVNNVPPGWLPRDGAAYSTTLYDLLFGVIGATFGGSGGSFNVPDDRGRLSAAADNLGTAAGAAGRLPTVATIGATAGEATHLLTITEMPSHAHTSVGVIGTGLEGSTATPFNMIGTAATSFVGGGAAHNNVQPTRGVLACLRF